MPYTPMRRDLTTERLTMGPWDASYAEELRHLHAERGDGTPTVERTREIIANGLAASAETGIALLPIRRRAEGDFIGYCGLIVGRATVEEPEIAYELFQRVHGNGYATEAARAVLDAAVATGRGRLWSTVRDWNAPSFRVLEKLGFERHHVTTDDRGDLVWLTRTLP
ncbi:GNAT family N-acetyltransferase [Glycomyces harbinensis]|uniref:Protein N-acetyltransferase, RimJ/RimL family n=1 Tax=Glycomyces harbinensis TaxID=58114 RepID=A0A1G6QST1_9ACTN|nr:GNAT family N-acetyltransferase [Glycomyces harbinensis]SDC95422.1 Protein N-acetyltransferase, RimJ/RimL family [Glycomyces harbinensis]